MAQTIPCDEHPEIPADYMITHIEDGEVMSLCGQSLIGFAIAYLSVAAPEQLAPPPKKTRAPRKPAAAAAASAAALEATDPRHDSEHAAG